MFRLSKSARNSLLAAAAIAALIMSRQHDADGNGGVSASIPSSKALTATKPASGGSGARAKRKDMLIGDRSLRGELDLSKMKRVEDHFEVPLPDKSQAVLTLDPKVQKAAEEVLAKAKAPVAAVVVMKTDGQLLALAGRKNEAPAKAKDYSLALSVWAPAASIFKIITASALVEGGLNPKAKACYHGGIRSVDKSMLVDSPKLDSTCNTLGFGLAKSQNALIAKLVHKHLDPKQLAKTANAFGFGKAPDFALDSEASRMMLPEDELEFARVAAGFWSTELSPLGGAVVANTIASGGFEVTPRIVKEVREKDRVIPVVGAGPNRVLSEATAESVAEMMSGTVRYGTAFKGFHDGRGRPFLGGTTVAGKTGSLTRNSPSHLAYSWFVGFAPADEPEVVISVLLGNPAKWYLKGHTAARLVLDAIY